MQKMDISQEGIDLVKVLEGFRAKAYPDAGGRMTIGYGHLLVKGDGVPQGDLIEPIKATELLKKDLASAVDCVLGCVTSNLTQNQFDALVIFTYNVGTSAFQSSTLLSLVNQGKFEEASEQLPRWCKVHTKQGAFVELAGLRNRRMAEQELFESPSETIVA